MVEKNITNGCWKMDLGWDGARRLPAFVMTCRSPCRDPRSA